MSLRQAANEQRQMTEETNDITAKMFKTRVNGQQSTQSSAHNQANKNGATNKAGTLQGDKGALKNAGDGTGVTDEKGNISTGKSSARNWRNNNGATNEADILQEGKGALKNAGTASGVTDERGNNLTRKDNANKRAASSENTQHKEEERRKGGSSKSENLGISSSMKMSASNKPVTTNSAEPSKVPHIRGIYNQGSFTCYINSVIQSLRLTDGFVEDILGVEVNERTMPTTSNIQSIFLSMLTGQETYYIPDNIANQIRPESQHGNGQRDCMEFLRHLLDILHEESQSTAQNMRSTDRGSHEETQMKSYSMFKKVFTGQVFQVCYCKSCGDNERTSVVENIYLESIKVLNDFAPEWVQKVLMCKGLLPTCPFCRYFAKIKHPPAALLVTFRDADRNTNFPVNLNVPADTAFRDLEQSETLLYQVAVGIFQNSAGDIYQWVNPLRNIDERLSEKIRQGLHHSDRLSMSCFPHIYIRDTPVLLIYVYTNPPRDALFNDEQCRESILDFVTKGVSFLTRNTGSIGNGIDVLLQAVFANSNGHDRNHPECQSAMSGTNDDPPDRIHQHDTPAPSQETTSGNHSLITKYFTGKTITDIKCGTCSTVETDEEIFHDIPLPLPKTEPTWYSWSQKSKESLLNLWRTYLKPAQMAEHNGYYCSVCDKKTTAKIATSISVAPEVLIITLQRYRQTQYSLQKNDIEVETPIDINLPHSANNTATTLYTLNGIIVHNGFSPTSGHYIFYGIHGQRCWKFNDDRVLPFELNKMRSIDEYIRNERSYILFYRKKEDGTHIK